MARERTALLDLVLSLPGIDASGVRLHEAVGRLSVGLLRRLLEAGAEVAQRERGTEALLVHKASGPGSLL